MKNQIKKRQVNCIMKSNFSMFKIYTFLNLMKVAPKEGVKTGYSRLLVQHFGKTLHVHVCRKNITHCWFYRDL